MKGLLSALVSVLLLFSSVSAEASGASKVESPPKRAILVVAFGSSVKAGEAAIDAVVQDVKAASPGIEVRKSYTSRIIMRKLAREQKRVIEEPALALARLASEGYTDVTVFSTHMMPGHEYQDLEAVVDGFRLMNERGTKAGFKRLALTKPLLSSTEDCEKLVSVLVKLYPATAGNAILLMGHGTDHVSGAIYSELQTVFQRNNPSFFVGVVEGTPSFDDMAARLRKSGSKKAILAPLMLVAGDHAINDMAGDEEDSWQSLLRKDGYKVESRLKGLGEYPEVRKLLLDRLEETWD